MVQRTARWQIPHMLQFLPIFALDTSFQSKAQHLPCSSLGSDNSSSVHRAHQWRHTMKTTVDHTDIAGSTTVSYMQRQQTGATHHPKPFPYEDGPHILIHSMCGHCYCLSQLLRHSGPSSTLLDLVSRKIQQVVFGAQLLHENCIF